MELKPIPFTEQALDTKRVLALLRRPEHGSLSQTPRSMPTANADGQDRPGEDEKFAMRRVSTLQFDAGPSVFTVGMLSRCVRQDPRSLSQQQRSAVGLAAAHRECFFISDHRSLRWRIGV